MDFEPFLFYSLLLIYGTVCIVYCNILLGLGVDEFTAFLTGPSPLCTAVRAAEQSLE